MPSQTQQLHFILFPLMAQGHMIPMVDIAKLLAQEGPIVSIFTTPLNAARHKTMIDKAKNNGLKIQVFELQFPYEASGLPQGCENFDMLPSLSMGKQMFVATKELEKPAEQLFNELTPEPSCIISDMCFPWTVNLAHQWKIPRISFCGFCCFYTLCRHKVLNSKILDSIYSETEYFVVPGLSETIRFNKLQLAMPTDKNFEEIVNRIVEAENKSYGFIINTFEELEPEFIKEYKQSMVNSKVWSIGPVSLCNRNISDKFDRGNKPLLNENECLNWLDSWQPKYVIYVCLGSLSNLATSQLIELGLGLEASNLPFIWVMREGERSKEIDKWVLDCGFKERIKGRGLVVYGWAPQVVILSHPAIGGFLTHCGWNSISEAISNGVPMVTWPLFADQFCNEKLVVEMLKIGVRVGVENPEKWGEEGKFGALVKKEDVVRAVDKLMKEDEGEEMRNRAEELGKMAKTATEEGGSSWLNIKNLVQDVTRKLNHE